MEPEKYEGNVEYKLKLVDKDNERIEQLVTQMRYRCNEGDGECIYKLGVEDNGKIEGLTVNEYEETIDNIKKIANKNNYSVTLLSIQNTTKEKKVYEVLIREINDNKYIDIKVAVAGNVDSAKTSTIGRLISGENDNGRGLSRSMVFNFRHELESGRTSSIAHQILGIDHKGDIVNYQGMNKMSWSDIVEKSSKVISFMDLAGHEKYLKTTILGLSSSFPDICFIMIAANNGISTMTKEHIFLCIALKIPFIIIITKIDICKDRKNILDNTVNEINKIIKLPIIGKIPFHIKNKDDIILASKNIYTNSIIPVFQISNVTGEGIDILTYFLNLLPKNPSNLIKNEEIVEYHIDNIFNVYGVGIVVGGQLISGKINVGDKLLLGPNNGSYENVVIKSIHCKKIPLQSISCGSYVCLGIKKIDRKNILRGNVIISSKTEKHIVTKFKANIHVLRTNNTTIKIGYEPMFHVSSIRQVVKILDIKEKKNARKNSINDVDNILRNGDSAIVEFMFKYKPQYIKVGTRFILCEGKCKLVGEIIDIN